MALTALGLFALLIGPVCSSEEDGSALLWRGQVVAIDALADVLSPESRADAAVWAEWARAHTYTVALDDGARILLLQPNGSRPGPRARASEDSKWLLPKRRPEKKALAAKLELVGDLLDRAEALYPMPPAEEAVASTPGTWTHGDTGEAHRNNLPVLIELRDQVDLHALLTRLESGHEYLREWAAGARNYSGILLTRPLLGAWLAKGGGLEEWSPKHELVNRATRLLLAQRYGRVPRWLELGLGWQAEFDLFDTAYSFPQREGFVFRTEHANWDKSLRRQFRKREAPLRMNEIHVVVDGVFRREEVTRSWGVAEFLVKRHPDAIAPLLLDLARDVRENGRRTEKGGGWSMIVDYETPAAVQEELLRRHVGEDVMEELLGFLSKGAR